MTRNSRFLTSDFRLLEPDPPFLCLQCLSSINNCLYIYYASRAMRKDKKSARRRRKPFVNPCAAWTKKYFRVPFFALDLAMFLRLALWRGGVQLGHLSQAIRLAGPTRGVRRWRRNESWCGRRQPAVNLPLRRDNPAGGAARTARRSVPATSTSTQIAPAGGDWSYSLNCRSIGSPQPPREHHSTRPCRKPSPSMN